MTVDEFNAYIAEQSPFARWLGVRLESIGTGTARMRLPYRDEFLRPGGVVNGPIVMAIADYAMYAAVVGLDRRGRSAVTTNLVTHFLRKTVGKDLIAEARAMRSGRRLAVFEVTVSAAGEDDPVAHVSGTYAFTE